MDKMSFTYQELAQRWAHVANDALCDIRRGIFRFGADMIIVLNNNPYADKNFSRDEETDRFRERVAASTNLVEVAYAVAGENDYTYVMILAHEDASDIEDDEYVDAESAMNISIEETFADSD